MKTECMLQIQTPILKMLDGYNKSMKSEIKSKIIGKMFNEFRYYSIIYCKHVILNHAFNTEISGLATKFNLSINNM